MYSAFKKLYLKPSQHSLKDCVKLLEYQFEKDSIPGHLCFRRLFNKEFAPEVIDKIRSLENALPDLNLIETLY